MYALSFDLKVGVALFFSNQLHSKKDVWRGCKECPSLHFGQMCSLYS